MLGPGKYDTECTAVRESTKARGCILLVIEGDKGTGFSAQLDLETTIKIPSLLRGMADSIDQDLKEGIV